MLGELVCGQQGDLIGKAVLGATAECLPLLGREGEDPLPIG